MRVDTQSHLLPPWFLDELLVRSRSPMAWRRDGETFLRIGRWTRRVSPKALSVDAKLADMDAAGVDVSLISPEQPGPELFGRESVRLARRLNDFIAGCVASQPARFAGLASLPLNQPTAAVEELRRATERGLRGALLYANVNGRPLDDPRFEPIFAAAEELGTVLYLHPAHPTVARQTADYDMIPGVGFMIDTALAALRLILAGYLDRFPGLTIVLPHTGGVLPYLIGRIDDQVTRLGRGGERISRLPSDYLRMMHTDTVAPDGRNLRFALEFWGADRILFATDHPFTQIQPYVDLVECNVPSPEERAAIFGGNAARLLGLEKRR